jgi:APA family basic amino acid/polyamine antiporter
MRTTDRTEAATPASQPTLRRDLGLVSAAAIGMGAIIGAGIFFAFTGYARLATLGEEVREPRRTIPRAIVLALGISAVLYAAVALVAVGAIGAAGLAATSAPLEQAARSLGVPGIPTIVAIGAITAMLGVLLSQQLGISRMMFAMSRRQDLPRSLGHVHAQHGTPDRAVLLTGAILVAVTILGRLEFIVAGAAFTILLYYAVTNLAALRLPPADRLVPRWIAAAGLASCIVLAFSLRPAVIASGLGLLVAGLVTKGLRQRLTMGADGRKPRDGPE